MFEGHNSINQSIEKAGKGDQPGAADDVANMLRERGLLEGESGSLNFRMPETQRWLIMLLFWFCFLLLYLPLYGLPFLP